MRFLLFVLFAAYLMACESPLKLEKFEFLVNKAKLQAPFSKNSYKLNKNFCNKYFFLTDGKYMTFKISEKSKEHKRSELRFLDEWSVFSKSEKFIEEKIKLVKFNKREFTFLQIHNGYKPLIRVVWYKNLKNRYEHLWAFIRLNELNGKQRKVTVFDLGECPKGFFDIKLSVKNGVLKLFLNGRKKFVFDVSYWRKKSYFKTGVYLQDEGEAEIYIDEMKF